jgi:hypothetical protein
LEVCRSFQEGFPLVGRGSEKEATLNDLSMEDIVMKEGVFL